MINALETSSYNILVIPKAKNHFYEHYLCYNHMYYFSFLMQLILPRLKFKEIYACTRMENTLCKRIRDAVFFFVFSEVQMSRPPAHPKGWAPVPSVTSPPVSFRPATPTRHSPVHRLPPPYIPCPTPMRLATTSSPLAAAPQPYGYQSPVSTSLPYKTVTDRIIPPPPPPH